MTSSLPHKQVRLLAIDGGGTTTEAWLAEPGCNVLGRGTAGPSNAKAVGPEAARLALDTAIHRAFYAAGLVRAPVDLVCLGLAGFDRPDDRNLLKEWAEHGGWAHNILIVNDGDLVIAAGTTQGWGVGVIAGTGSIAVGRTKDGHTARAGGWGYLIGDEGSAYGVVLDALRLVARRADGRDPHVGRDPLTTRMCAALGVTNTEQIIPALYAPTLTRSRIASLAPEVLAACAEAPETADQLLTTAGTALGEIVSAVARSLGWTSGTFPLAVAGSFLLSAELVRQRMIGYLMRQGYEPNITVVTDPVRGALLLAEQALTPTPFPERNELNR